MLGPEGRDAGWKGSRSEKRANVQGRKKCSYVVGRTGREGARGRGGRPTEGFPELEKVGRQKEVRLGKEI